MSNEKHKKLLVKGVKTWNRWRSNHPEIKPDLSRAMLKDLELIGFNLNHSDLCWVFFTGSNLSYCDFSSSDLSHADFTNANLSFADFSNAILDDCDFTNAICNGTIFERNIYNIDTIIPDGPDEE